MIENNIEFKRRQVRFAWAGMTGLSLLTFVAICLFWTDIRGLAFGLSMGLWTYSGGYLLWKVMALSAGRDGENLRLVVGDPAGAAPDGVSSRSFQLDLLLIRIIDQQNRWGSLFMLLAFTLAGGLSVRALATGAALGACVHFGPRILRDICAAAHRVADTQVLAEDDRILFRLATA